MILNSFMAAFFLYNFHAKWIWWIGYIIIMLLEVLYELDLMEKERLFKEKLKGKK